MASLYKSCACCLALLVPAYATGAWQDDDELFSLSLEQLMNVTIASKKNEMLAQAPSTMTVIDQAQIRQFGARNLRDILDRFVNMQVVGSNLYPHNRLSIRGVTQTHTDNKVLMLINGRVLRDANQGGINTDIYNFFPINIIKKIEIIRGPGSTLFGTNAFSGVINIVTSKKKEDISEVNLSFGENSSLQTTLESNYVLDEGQFQIVAHQLDTDGEVFKNLNGEFGTTGDYQTNKSGTQILFNGDFKHLTFNGLLSDSHQEHVKSLFQFPSTDLNIIRHHLDIGYGFQLSDKFLLETNVTYNFHEVDFDISNTRDTRTDTQDYLFESDLKATLSDTSNLIFGVRYEKLEGTIGNQSDSPTHFNTYQYGLFTQFDAEVNRQNKFVIGAQYNDSELDEGRISPRFAFIHYFSSAWTTKILYGEAFRSPFGTDLFLDSPSLQGNEELKPETIATFDFQLLYLSDSRYLTTTLYSSRHKNLHQRIDVSGTPTFVNQGQVDYMGLEIELREILSPHTEITLNASYQENEDQDGIQHTTFNPMTMIKAGLTHSFSDGVQFNIFNGYFSKPTKLSDIGDAPENINEEASAYNWATMNIQAEGKFISSHPIAKQITLGLYVDNLLDETIYFPSINRQNVSTLPHHNGRSFHLNTRFTF